MATEEDWTRVGRKINARMGELVIGPADVKARGGPTGEMLNGYIAGKPIVRKTVKRGLCAALRWTADSIDRILRGDEPVEVPDAVGDGVAHGVVAPTIEDRVSRLERAVAQQGETLEEIRRIATGRRSERPA